MATLADPAFLAEIEKKNLFRRPGAGRADGKGVRVPARDRRRRARDDGRQIGLNLRAFARDLYAGAPDRKGFVMIVATTNDLAGHKTVRYVGVVRGIVVRSRSVVGNIGASIQSLFGGNITLYTSLCEQARADAYTLMVEHAQEMGANAIVAMRYDANEIAAGITEVLAYGTAVVVDPAP